MCDISVAQSNVYELRSLGKAIIQPPRSWLWLRRCTMCLDTRVPSTYLYPNTCCTSLGKVSVDVPICICMFLKQLNLGSYVSKAKLQVLYVVSRVHLSYPMKNEYSRVGQSFHGHFLLTYTCSSVFHSVSNPSLHVSDVAAVSPA